MGKQIAQPGQPGKATAAAPAPEGSTGRRKGARGPRAAIAPAQAGKVPARTVTATAGTASDGELPAMQGSPLQTGTGVLPREVPKDDPLIIAIKGGDELAFQQLVLKYEQRVYNHCLRMVNDEVESYDLTQEVFLKVFRKIAHYEHTYAFYTWLYRITVNCCIDYMRRKRRELPSISLSMGGGDDGQDGREMDVPDSTSVPDTALLNQELDQVLRHAIGQLSEKLRTIIILKEVEGFSYEEIAEVLGCSRGTVKSRLFRARERLKELLAHYVGDQGERVVPED